MEDNLSSPLLGLEEGQQPIGKKARTTPERVVAVARSVFSEAWQSTAWSTPPPSREVKLCAPSGEVRKVRVQPKLAFLGGGGIDERIWYGPQGVLRIAVVVCLSLAAFLLVCLPYLLCERADFFTDFSSTLLIPTSSLVAVLLVAQKGIANQVDKQAIRNNRFASMGDQMSGQLSNLTGVADRLAEVAKTQNTDKVLSVSEEMVRCSDLAKISTIVQAFADADMLRVFQGVRPDAILNDSEEVSAFIEGFDLVARENIANFDIKELAAQRGFTQTEVDLLIAAVVTENEQEGATMLALMYFLLAPSAPERRTRAQRLLGQHLAGSRDFGTDEKLSSELERLAGTAGSGQRVPAGQASMLTRAVLRKIQAEDDLEEEEQDDEAEEELL